MFICTFHLSRHCDVAAISVRPQESDDSDSDDLMLSSSDYLPFSSLPEQSIMSSLSPMKSIISFLDISSSRRPWSCARYLQGSFLLGLHLVAQVWKSTGAFYFAAQQHIGKDPLLEANGCCFFGWCVPAWCVRYRVEVHHICDEFSFRNKDGRIILL
jgi:hypothetical protein